MPTIWAKRMPEQKYRTHATSVSEWQTEKEIANNYEVKNYDLYWLRQDVVQSLLFQNGKLGRLLYGSQKKSIRQWSLFDYETKNHYLIITKSMDSFSSKKTMYPDSLNNFKRLWKTRKDFCSTWLTETLLFACLLLFRGWWWLKTRKSHTERINKPNERYYYKQSLQPSQAVGSKNI